ncbi:MAG: hypothetical protein V4704_04210 [Pseudomonadota bacterium]
MRTANATLVVLACVALNGCSPPGPPDEERRPAPQAGAQAQPRSAIVRNAEAYKDSARSAEAESLEAADRQRAEIDAQTQ